MTDAVDRHEKRECPYPECDWEDWYDPEDYDDELMSEERATWHFERVHKGEVRLRVVLEAERSMHPEQDLTDMVDSIHDVVGDSADLPRGLEVAFAYGEVIEEPDELPKQETDA